MAPGSSYLTMALWSGEREDVSALPALLPKKDIPIYQKIMWGTVPMLCLVMAFFFNVQLHWINHIVKGNVNRDSYGNPETLRETIHPITYFLSKYWFYLVLLFVFLIISNIYLINLKQDTPSKTVISYYNALDFGEFEEAYGYLNSPDDYTLQQFMLEKSVTDGLVESYGKLDDIRTNVVSATSDHAFIKTDLTFITPLEVFHRTKEHVLIKRGNKWLMQAEPLEYAIPADQFVFTNATNFKNQGRKKITTEETFHTDILDRPVLHVLEAALVYHKEKYSVVGMLQNIDSYPADISLKAKLYDTDSSLLIQYTGKIPCYSQACS